MPSPEVGRHMIPEQHQALFAAMRDNFLDILEEHPVDYKKRGEIVTHDDNVILMDVFDEAGLPEDEVLVLSGLALRHACVIHQAQRELTEIKPEDFA